MLREKELMYLSTYMRIFLVLLLSCLPLVLIQSSVTKVNNLSINSLAQTQRYTRHTYSQRNFQNRLPLSFEANYGQVSNNSESSFISRGNGYTLFLSPIKATLALRKAKKNSLDLDNLQQPDLLTGNKLYSITDRFRTRDENLSTETLQMEFLGANSQATTVGLEELPGKVNYFIGNEESKWRIDVPTFAKVKYEDIYPNIDLVYYGNQRQLEYDLIARPGANLNNIAINFNNHSDINTNINIEDNGDLVIRFGDREIRKHKPIIYQEINGIKQQIKGNYILRDKNEIGFEVSNYDINKSLIIDPILTYSSYLGGLGDDDPYSIVLDDSGNIYITGATNSLDFPIKNPNQSNNSGDFDIFIAKLNPTGTSLVYSTYLGGGDLDIGTRIAVDNGGNAYITGFTYSTNFPRFNAFQSSLKGEVDTFIVKLNPAGNSLVYSTYLGGNGDEFGSSLSIDGSNNVYIAGLTSSLDFPIVNGFQSSNQSNSDAKQEGYIVKINASGNQLVYSTYFGGSANEGIDDMVADRSGNVYVVGTTNSTNFPVKNAIQGFLRGNFDTFVAKLSSSGNTLIYSTYLGGSNQESLFLTGSSIAIDSSGNSYISGSTASTDFPTTTNALQSSNRGLRDIYVAKLNTQGGLIYSTYLGGLGDEAATGKFIAVDSLENIYITGHTNSLNFPVKDSLQTTKLGRNDVFLAKINSSGNSLIYSTYLGGSEEDLFPNIFLDSKDDVYLTGSTSSKDFPTKDPFQSNSVGAQDTFIVKITNDCLIPTISPNSLPSATVGTAYNQSFTTNISGTIFSITAGKLPDGLSLSPAGIISGTPTITGSFSFTVKATPSSGCPNSINLVLTVNNPESTEDFAIAVTPKSQTVMAGVATSFTIDVQKIGNFTKSINLSVSVSPPNSILSFNFTPGVVMPGNGATLTLSTPANFTPRTFTLSINGTDGQRLRSQDVTVTINAPTNLPPVVNAIANQTINAGTTRDIQVSASDPNGNNGLKLIQISTLKYVNLTDSGNGSGTIRIAPSTSDTEGGVVTIEATDTNGLVGRTSFNIILIGSPNNAPTINSITDQTLQPNEVRNIAVSASDTDSLTGLVLMLLSPPTYVSLTDTGNGMGVIRIAPTTSDVGARVTVQARDSGGLTAQTSFNVTIQTPSSNVVIENVLYVRPTLTITGKGFGTTTVDVNINGSNAAKATITSIQNDRIVLKGTPKRLNVKKDSNVVTVTVNGAISNTFKF